MIAFFREILYRPLLNGLVFLYENVTFEDLGLAIILLTVIIRFIVYPLFYKSFKSQTMLQKLQPEIKEIQKKYKNNREEQAKKLLELYKERNVNPFSSFGLLLVQMPILIALYRVFLNGFGPEIVSDLYSFIPPPETITNTLLGLIDLTERNILIVVLAAGAQYIQGKLSLARKKAKKEGVENEPASPAEKMGERMVFVAPLLTIAILFNLPAAIGVYWLTTAVFSIGQQHAVNKALEKENSAKENNEGNSNTHTETA